MLIRLQVKKFFGEIMGAGGRIRSMVCFSDTQAMIKALRKTRLGVGRVGL